LSAFWSGVADARPFFDLVPARRENRVANAGAAKSVAEADDTARVMLTVRVARDERFQNCAEPGDRFEEPRFPQRRGEIVARMLVKATESPRNREVRGLCST
jgi:hypothetical protein